MEGNTILKKIWRLAPQGLRSQALNLLLRRKFARLARKPCPGPIFVGGAFRSISGMGQGARLYARELAQAGRPVYRLDLGAAMRMPAEIQAGQNLLAPESLSGMHGGLLVLHANPPQFQLALLALPDSFLEKVHIRAYWAWEWEDLPAHWLQALRYVDSIEAPSRFCRTAFSRYTGVPVSLHPHATLAPRKIKTAYCGDGIVRCLSIFDAGSSFERKNPQAALEVFRAAFKGKKAMLTFKISHAGADRKAYRAFRTQCAKFPEVRIMEEQAQGEALTDLYLAHDIYISLHRSEGFGLTIKEALDHGLHVLATAWSGNLDYMRGPLCHLAPCQLASKRWPDGPMKGLEGRWAEVDTCASARILAGLGSRLLAEASQPT